MSYSRFYNPRGAVLMAVVGGGAWYVAASMTGHMSLFLVLLPVACCALSFLASEFLAEDAPSESDAAEKNGELGAALGVSVVLPFSILYARVTGFLDHTSPRPLLQAMELMAVFGAPIAAAVGAAIVAQRREGELSFATVAKIYYGLLAATAVVAWKYVTLKF
jgi:hypothetical protein